MERDEFEHIATALRGKALAAIAFYGMDSDTMEDVVQDAMLKMWTLHDRIPNERAAMVLVRQITRNAAIDLLRSQKKTVDEEALMMLPDETSSPLQQLESKEWLQWMEESIRRLPASSYRILLLRQNEQLSNTDIARILGITPQSVAVQLSRCRKRLLEEMKQRREMY